MTRFNTSCVILAVNLLSFSSDGFSSSEASPRWLHAKNAGIRDAQSQIRRVSLKQYTSIRTRARTSANAGRCRSTTTQLCAIDSPRTAALSKLATLAGEQAIKWLIPAIAIRLLFGGFRALLGNQVGGDKKRRKQGGDEQNEALADIIGEGREFDNDAFYNEEILEDIAMGTNLGPWSPNGYVWRRYTDLLSAGNRERRPVSRLFSWFLGGDSDIGGPAGGGGGSLFARDGRRNPALPRLEYLRVEPINERLESYGFSVKAALKSRAVAASALKKKNFERAYGLAVGAGVGAGAAGDNSDPLEEEEMAALVTAEAVFLTKSASTLGNIHVCDRELRDLSMKRAFHNIEIDDNEDKEEEACDGAAPIAMSDEDGEEKQEEVKVLIDINAAQSKRKRLFAGRLGSPDKTADNDQDEAKAEALMLVLGQFNQDLIQYELDFIASVVEVLGPIRAPLMRAALLHTSGPAGRLVSSIKGRPLEIVLGELGLTDPKARRKNLFVLDFPGDISASQVKMLREEVTGVIRSSCEGDEALVVLKSGGGSVTGYGLAAGQLQRLKDAGLRLTICVEELAASGGYMMCCVADHIVASPFAALGSVGVVLTSPNFYERLKREGVEVQTITAGKYKRTLTPTGKITKEDKDKVKEEAEEVLALFRSYVEANRPSLNLDEVATGEVWFGSDALAKGLCDETATKDDILLRFVDNDFDVFSVKFEEPKDERGGLRDLLPVGAAGGTQTASFIRRFIREIVHAAKDEIRGSDSDKTMTSEYMVLDDTTSRRSNITL